MFRTNKIINQALLPKLFLTVALSIGIPGTCVYVAKQNEQNAKRIGNRDKWLMSLISFMVLGFCFCTYEKYKEAEKFSIMVARKHLRNAMKDMPDMKMFSTVLDNPKAMKNIANLISNSLRLSEQERINDIVRETLAKLHKYQTCYLEEEELDRIYRKFFAKAREDIIKVIQGHAAVHPEFIQDIYKAMVYADMTYIVQQRTR